MSSDTIAPKLPFVWPEPLVSAGSRDYAWQVPIEGSVGTAQSIFGVVSAIDKRAIHWIEPFLAGQADRKLRLVLSLYPTCHTSVVDLQNLLQLTQRYGDRAAFKVYPEESLQDRASNLLCLRYGDGSLAVSSGPTENLGFARVGPSRGNLVIQVSAATFEACRKWFDYLWAVAGPLRPEIAAAMPRLVLPEGEIEAARQWEQFREQCLDQQSVEASTVQVDADPDSGAVILRNAAGEPLVSPTTEIGIPALDPFDEAIARVFELGVLVSIDKLTRIPPLEAPVKPAWFGVESFKQTGMVSAKTSIKVAPFDDKLLKKLDRLRRTSGELLPRYSFALADGIRWMPKKAIPLFDAELTAANENAKRLLGSTLGGSVEEFLASQRDRIRSDAQGMYEAYHPGAKIPESTVDYIIEELRTRLGKATADKIIPQVAYTPIEFNPVQSSAWASPWGQVLSLLRGIAEYPRIAMTNPYFWRGIGTDEGSLIQAMNVAADCFIPKYDDRKAKPQAENELELIKQLGDAPGDTKAKCKALWDLITAGSTGGMTTLIGGPPAQGQ